MAPKAKATSFDKLDVKIRLNNDSTFAVRERIRFDFDLKEEVGIVRKLPLEYSIDDKVKKLEISDVQVFDDSNNPYPFNLVQTDKELEVHIGDSDKTVTGRQYYNLTYTVKGAVQNFRDYDEWRWNIMGGKWQVRADSVEADVYLPQDVDEASVRSKCEYGFYMSTDACSFELKKGKESLKVEKITFNQSYVLAGEQMLITIGLPRGIMSPPPSLMEKTLIFWSKNWTKWIFFSGALIILIVHFKSFLNKKKIYNFLKKTIRKSIWRKKV